MRSLIVGLLALLTDSPVFCDRQTWTSERTSGNVYSLSLRWSSEVTGQVFFFVSASVFPLNCTTCSILRDVLREMVNK